MAVHGHAAGVVFRNVAPWARSKYAAEIPIKIHPRFQAVKKSCPEDAICVSIGTKNFRRNKIGLERRSCKGVAK